MQRSGYECDIKHMTVSELNVINAAKAWARSVPPECARLLYGKHKLLYRAVGHLLSLEGKPLSVASLPKFTALWLVRVGLGEQPRSGWQGRYACEALAERGLLRARGRGSRRYYTLTASGFPEAIRAAQELLAPLSARGVQA